MIPNFIIARNKPSFVPSFSAQIRVHDIDTEIENEPQFGKIDRRYRASSTSNEKVCVLPIDANQKLEFAVLSRFFFLPLCKKKKKERAGIFVIFFLRSASLKGIFFNGCERDRDNEEKGRRNIWFTVACLRYGNETFVIYRL